MHPRLIKLTIAKQTLAPRKAVRQWMDHTFNPLVYLPQRCEADAIRIARSYAAHYNHQEVLHMTDGQAMFFGLDHLFEGDLRRLAYALVEDDVDPLWPGLWLCLSHAPALAQVAELDTLVTCGSIALRTLTLADWQDTRETLAEALGESYREQMAHLAHRLTKPRPNVYGVEADYRRLCTKMRRSEEVLGVLIPCLAEQQALEKALVRFNCLSRLQGDLYEESSLPH
jgi:hypothetical protein